MPRKPITQAMRQAVAVRLGGSPGTTVTTGCAYCNSSIIHINWSEPERVRFLDVLGRSYPELDHVVSVAHGGPHTPDNLVPACLSCNRQKCSDSVSDWSAKRLANARAIADEPHGQPDEHVNAPTPTPVPTNSFKNVGEVR